MGEVVARFATSSRRRTILRGLFGYRSALKAIGVTVGYQWLDGSFVEDVERLRSRPPDDIDIVTVAYRPGASEWAAFMASPLLNPDHNKAIYKVHSFYLDLGKAPHLLLNDTVYLYGLFAHQRDTATWKGMIRVPLQSDDAQALADLNAADEITQDAADA